VRLSRHQCDHRLEIALKAQSGRLRLPKAVHTWMAGVLDGSGFDALHVTMAHAVAALSVHHPDPFHRLLIAQAEIEHLTIVTSGPAFDDYDVKVLDARV